MRPLVMVIAGLVLLGTAGGVGYLVGQSNTSEIGAMQQRISELEQSQQARPLNRSQGSSVPAWTEFDELRQQQGIEQFRMEIRQELLEADMQRLESQMTREENCYFTYTC